MNFKKIINILVLISILILLINSYVIYKITKIQKKQSKVINIAGRQRMLTQKTTKEILHKRYEDYDTFKLLRTINEFQKNLEDLKYGNEDRGIPPTKNEQIMKQQIKVTKIWNEFRKNVKIILNNNESSLKTKKAFEYIKDNNMKLLNEVNKAVKLYEENSIQTITIIIQIIILIIGIIIILITKIIVTNIINKAEIDHLTNIYSRKKFSKELEKELERVKRYDNRLGLIMFDIDYFKKINDTYGHDVGDEVLKMISNEVDEKIRDIDIFARWGGDEFMIIMPNTDIQGAKKLAERLKKHISQINFDKIGQITCSFGVIENKKDDLMQDMIKRVDNALYEAKEEGRNKVVDK